MTNPESFAARVHPTPAVTILREFRARQVCHSFFKFRVNIVRSPRETLGRDDSRF